MKKIYFMLLAIFLSFNTLNIEKINAQITGIKNIPGNYATLAIAIANLNSVGVGAGGVTLNLIAAHPQTAPVGGYRITAIGTAANTITIKGNGNTITASGTQPIGSIKDAVFMIKGGDYITLDGFVLRENPSNAINNDGGINNMTEWGIALLYASLTNGAQNNTIKNCTISLNNNYGNTFGIYSNTRHDSVNVGTAVDITSITGANSNNKVYNNSISNVGRPVSFVGSANPAFMDSGNDIGGSSLTTANSITNWSFASSNDYVSVDHGDYGITLVNEIGSNVSFNSLSTTVSSNDLTGIYQVFYPNNPTGTFTNTISNNSITLAATTLFSYGGIFNAIYTYGGVSTMTLSILNNIISNCSFFGLPWNIEFIRTASPAKRININSNVFQGNISVSGSGCTGIANFEIATDSININNNQFGNNTGGVISSSGKGGFFGISNVPGTSSGAAISISNNNFQGINYSATSTTDYYFIYNQATNCGSININDNTFTNLSVNNTGNIIFITNYGTRLAGTYCNVNNNSIVTAFNNIGVGGTVQVYSGGNTSPINTIETNSNNNFSNITLNGGNSSLALWSNGDKCGKVISNNTFNNLSGIGTGGFIAIEAEGSDTLSTVKNITGNIISNISTNGQIFGIRSTGGSLNIFKNKIYNLQTNNVNGTVNGIYLTSGKVNVYNNLIGDLKAPSANKTTDAIIGINENGANANFYFNTIYLNAGSTGTNFSTSGIYHTASSISTTGPLNLRNNIIVNTSTPNGTGKTVAYKRSSILLNNYTSTSNNNLFYAGVPGSSKLIFYDGTNSDQTISAYKTRVAPRDSNSFSENPNFLSVSGSNANFLHIDPAIATQIESGGINIPGITDDYDGNIRNASTPDVGADEFTGTHTLNLTVFVQGFYNDITNSVVQDTVKVYLRNSASPYVIVDSAMNYLSSSGSGIFNFLNAVNGVNYYIQIKHRNSIETWSKTTQAFAGNTLTYNFTTAITKAFGDNMIQVDASPVGYAIYSGDVNQDGTIDASDLSDTDNNALAGLSGYVRTDVTGDDYVDAADVSVVDNNAFNSVSVIRP